MKKSIVAQPTIERVQELFDYNGEDLIWENPTKRCKQTKGQRAGCIRYDGEKHNIPYWYVCFDSTRHPVPRIIWFLKTGDWPGPHEIDHIDGNGLNNKWENLRRVERKKMKNVQMLNRGIHSTNTSGFRGIAFKTKTQKFEVSLQRNGKQEYLATTDTPDEGFKIFVSAYGDYHGRDMLIHMLTKDGKLEFLPTERVI